MRTRRSARHRPAQPMLDLEALDRNGWVALPGLLAPDEAAGLAARLTALLATGGSADQGDKRTGGTRRADTSWIGCQRSSPSLIIPVSRRLWPTC